MKKTAFTMMELLVTITLVSIIAAFIIPNFRRSITKTHERDMIAQLETLHAANTVFFSNQGKFYVDTTAVVITLNSNLNINLISNDGTTFSYTCIVPGTNYTFDASWGGFTIRITDAPLSPTNPNCQSGPGTCPTL